MLFTFFPLAKVDAVVGPHVDAVAVFFVVSVFADVDSAVLKGVDAEAVHVIV